MRSLLVLLVLVFVPALTAAADEAADKARRIEKLLAAPPTPAIPLQLLESTGDPRVDAYWAASLSHADPAVRGATSRAIRSAGRVGLTEAVAATLASEADAMAASEHADALVELTGRAHPTALAAAARFPRPVRRTLVTSLARVTPVSLVLHLDLLLAKEVGVEHASSIIDALRTSSPDIATHVMRRLLEGRVRLAWRIVARTFKRRDEPVPPELVAMGRLIVDASAHEDMDADVAGDAATQAASDEGTSPNPPSIPTMTADDLPAGFLEGHVRSSGCRTAGTIMYGQVEHDRAGRPRTISLPNEVSEACRRAMTTVLRQSRSIGAGSRVVVLPLKPPPRLGDRLMDGPVLMDVLKNQMGSEPPRAIKQVRPQYPEHAKNRRVAGKVWLDVVIDEHGIPREIAVSRTVDGDLNREAMLAMTQWRFTPAMENGTPMPVRVVVEMAFVLR